MIGSVVFSHPYVELKYNFSEYCSFGTRFVAIVNVVFPGEVPGSRYSQEKKRSKSDLLRRYREIEH